MAQVTTVMKGDPNSLKDLLNTLAATNEIQIITKTKSAGSFVVVYDDAGGIGQTVEVLRGDPYDLVNAMNALITGGADITILQSTFSAAYYLVVYS